MESQLTDLFCCPKYDSELIFKELEMTAANGSCSLLCSKCGSEYKIDDGFVQFIRDDEVFRFSKREEFFRTFIYDSFYTPITNFMFLPCGGVRNARREVQEHLEIKPKSNILETGIETGDNFLFLKDKLNGGSYYGLENQLRMPRSFAVN